MKTGIVYASFCYSVQTNKWFVLTGSTEDEVQRLKSYRVLNATFQFDYKKDVPFSKMKDHEENLQKLFRKKRFIGHGNSPEQFIFDDEDEVNSILSEWFGKPAENNGTENYARGTLSGVIVDEREYRPDCAWLQGQTAMIKDKKNKDPFRKTKSYFTLDYNQKDENGNKIGIIKEHSTLEPQYMSKDAWDVWQTAVKHTKKEYGVGEFANEYGKLDV
tara:strand:+ start:240 stop:890 length:651 start_codon:yes stop_codon:yes gene_type:complete